LSEALRRIFSVGIHHDNDIGPNGLLICIRPIAIARWWPTFRRRRSIRINRIVKSDDGKMELSHICDPSSTNRTSIRKAVDEMDLSIRRINSAEATQSSRSGINIVTFGRDDSTPLTFGIFCASTIIHLGQNAPPTRVLSISAEQPRACVCHAEASTDQSTSARQSPLEPS
jgi:hypothetical protein